MRILVAELGLGRDPSNRILRIPDQPQSRGRRSLEPVYPFPQRTLLPLARDSSAIRSLSAAPRNRVACSRWPCDDHRGRSLRTPRSGRGAPRLAEILCRDSRDDISVSIDITPPWPERQRRDAGIAEQGDGLRPGLHRLGSSSPFVRRLDLIDHERTSRAIAEIVAQLLLGPLGPDSDLPIVTLRRVT